MKGKKPTRMLTQNRQKHYCGLISQINNHAFGLAESAHGTQVSDSDPFGLWCKEKICKIANDTPVPVTRPLGL